MVSVSDLYLRVQIGVAAAGLESELGPRRGRSPQSGRPAEVRGRGRSDVPAYPRG